jgi:hypothetical protein
MTKGILRQLIDKHEQIFKEISKCEEIIKNPPYDVDVNNIRDVKNPKNIEKIDKNQLIEEIGFIEEEISELIEYVSGYLENELSSREKIEDEFWEYVNKITEFYEAVDEYCYSISGIKEPKEDSGKEFNDEIDKKSEKGGGASGKYFNN